MDEQLAIERMMEIENLTDALDDDAANLLLEWGTTQIQRGLKGLTEEEAANLRLQQIMDTMRTLNTIIGDRQTKSPDELAESLCLLMYRASLTMDKSLKLDGKQVTEIADELGTLEARPALVRAMELLQTGTAEAEDESEMDANADPSTDPTKPRKPDAPASDLTDKRTPTEF